MAVQLMKGNEAIGEAAIIAGCRHYFGYPITPQNELPAVVVNMMRGGPGLGNIAGAQGDYFQAVKGGGNGDYHCIVLAPSTVQELADLTVKNILRAKKAIMKGLRNQVEGKGYSFIEVLSMCPTGWGLEPAESTAWIDANMAPVFPLGNLRDR